MSGAAAGAGGSEIEGKTKRQLTVTLHNVDYGHLPSSSAPNLHRECRHGIDRFTRDHLHLLRRRAMPTVELTKDNFEATINDNDTIVVDFWAEWCGPCRVFGPTFEEASDKHSDIVFGKVDTETQQELAGFFNVRSIPTLMVFRENVVLYSEAGALPADSFETLLSQIKEVDMEDVHRQVAEMEAKDDHDHAGHDH